MFADTRQQVDGRVLRAQVCVVGGGIAGIVLALEFERRGIDTILLESGGFDADEATRDLYRGDNVGLPYVFGDGCRDRCFGGSSNGWGGWNAPLQEHDMERRDWVPDSGWPFDRRELEPYYQRAYPILQMGQGTFDVGRWVEAINREDVCRLPLRSGRILDSISRFSTPSRLGSIYRSQLQNARHVQVYLHANVVDIETRPAPGVVSGLRVKTISGRELRVESKYFVIACGGIDNARLLLSCTGTQAGGLGNANDLVGRYFADHPRLTLGTVRLNRPWKRNKLYDIKFHYRNRAVAAQGTYVSGLFSVDPELQRREGLLNAQLWFNSAFPGEGTRAAEALIRLKQRLHGRLDPGFGVWSDLFQLARHPVNTAGFVLARLLQPEILIRTVRIDVICEPSPNRDSRVTLTSARDALGMRRVCVDWRLDPQVKHTFDRSLAIFAHELRASNVGEVDLPEPLVGREWPYVHPTAWNNMGTWHHMGTTRMHDSPSLGVVDRHCRVHGVANLFVAGSSVFPTYGANFPTVTIAALSLRLADHIGLLVRAPDALVQSDRAPPVSAPERSHSLSPELAVRGATP